MEISLGKILETMSIQQFVPLTNLTPATLTLTRALHDGRPIYVTKVDGFTATLPEAVGSGAIFELVQGATVTSVGTILKVANATDTMIGAAVHLDGLAVVTNYRAGATADTVTFNGTTTGGIVGSTVVARDIAVNIWEVQVRNITSGTSATPFTATV